MKQFIYFVLFFIGLTNSSFAQNLNELQSASDNHQLVKGTNISMIPPSGFLPSENFKGFQNPADPTAMIMIMEIPGPFLEVSKGFNKEMMTSRGMELNHKKAVQVNVFSGFLIDLEQEGNGMRFSKTILVYGDSTTTTLINGVSLKDSLTLGAAILESVQSTFVNSNLDINPRAELDYFLEETTGDLKFFSVMGNAMLFNRDLKTPTESEDKATLITDKSFAKVAIADKKLFCISRLKEFSTTHQWIEDKGVNEIELDGLKGFELYGSDSNNETEEMYQAIVFVEDGGYYLFVGTYLKGSETAEADIKKVIGSFMRKK